MTLNPKTLEKLRTLINEETEYRKGPELVKFFNELGGRDVYGQGFPSRWVYTDEKLLKINGTADLDKCIKKLFNPINFVGRVSALDKHIADFNQYLSFDKWHVIRTNAEIGFQKSEHVKLHDDYAEVKEDEFLNKEFTEISLDGLKLDGVITDTIKVRLEEIKKCFGAKASLSVIFLAGSTLEGILLGVGLNHLKEFNQAKASPKDKEGNVKRLSDWTLSNLIDVAYENKFLKEDVRKFSHSLRDFRNYIHPYAQASTGFNPDEHTAKICWQVLKAAIYQVIACHK